MGFILLVGACERAATHPPLVARDSASVRILEVNADAIAGSIELAPTPSWSVGGDDDAPGALTLFGITDLALSGADELLIAEGSTQQVVRVRLADGRVERFGGAGDGPNEFRALQQVFATGERYFAAFDHRRRRFVEFGPDGAVLAETEIPLVSLGGIDFLQPLAAGGFMLGSISTFESGGAERRYRGRSPVVRVGEGTVDTIVVVPGMEMFDTGEAVGGVLYGATSLVAGTRAGIWIADTAHPEAAFWSAAGARETLVRWRSREPRALGRAQRDAFWARLGAELSEQERAAFLAAQSQAVFADTMPAFGSLIADAAGRLWIGSPVGPERQMLRTPWPAQRWIVVDAATPAVYRATTPEGFRLMKAGADYVLGVFEDELGRESVRRYPITTKEAP